VRIVLGTYRLPQALANQIGQVFAGHALRQVAKHFGVDHSIGEALTNGDDYLRTRLIQGAKATFMSAGKRVDPIWWWLAQLTARVGWQKACVAMANKNARIVWAVMTREEGSIPSTSASNKKPDSRTGRRS